MKREQLQELGLESSQINSVMGMHGAVVNDLNEQVRTLQKEKEQLDQQNDTYEKEIEHSKQSRIHCTASQKLNCFCFIDPPVVITQV